MLRGHGNASAMRNGNNGKKNDTGGFGKISLNS
jgi:hypothetical protein